MASLRFRALLPPGCVLACAQVEGPDPTLPYLTLPRWKALLRYERSELERRELREMRGAGGDDGT